jgi:hypothetical protein
LICRSIKEPKLKNHYKTYCRILTEVIKTDKKSHYNKLIINSSNKTKTLCEIFTERNVDTIFNKFLNTYLRIFYHSFPYKKSHHNHNNKAWITAGIKISSQYNRDLYLICNSTKDPKLKNHYKTYCRILTEVIKTAKK